MITYESHEGPLSHALLSKLASIAFTVFDMQRAQPPAHTDVVKRLEAEVAGFRWVHLCLAYEDDALVAYKLGRSSDPRSFESSLGGVLPRLRRRGIASELAQRQEEWCKAQGFRFLTTETASDNQAMLILNLKRGFTIVGTYRARGEHLKVRCEKALSEFSQGDGANP